MAVIVYPNTFAPNTLASAAEVNANFNAITAQVNGNLEAANLADNAVTTAKIDDGAVTNAKVADVAATKLTGTISNSQFRASAAYSVVGRSANSSGDVADISAASDGQVLRRDGATLGFGQLVTSAYGDGSITGAKLANGNVTPEKTSFLGSNTTAIYHGRITSAGVGTSLPSGWSASRLGSGVYRITHGLGSTNLGVLATTEDTGIPMAVADVITTTTFEVETLNTSFARTDVGWSFTLFTY